jgi:hypothetical protein
LVELVWVYFLYPETKGPTLEEISRIFDGDAAVAHISMDQIEKEVAEERRASYDEKHAARVEQTRV